MDAELVMQKIEGVVRDELDDDAITLAPWMAAKDVDGWDSLANVRIMVGIERAFKVRFNTVDITKAKNIEVLVAMVQAALA